MDLLVSSVKTGMSSSRPPKNLPKKVNPPHVPIPLDNLNHSFRHSGSSFSSAGYVSAEDSIANLDGAGGTTTFTQLMPPPDTLGSTMGSLRDDQSDYGSTVSKSPGSNNYMVTSNAFTFPVPRGETLTHKAAVFYHQQLALQEDQGIDLQSPLQGRDSPGSNSAGSGSRHSTASLDSGKASSYLTSSSNRGGSSIGSGSGGVSGTSPRCSVSSCSISEHDVISDWLMELHFEEYAQLFSQAGYDLATISRMTPEDLTAIGIKKPHHREKIKQHIDNLQLPDQLPIFVPGSIDEWLRLLRLDEYTHQLLQQGYKTVVDVTQITWEDLEDIGIVRLGHQKKILLAIKRVKDIINGKGKWVPSNFQQYQQHILPQQQQIQLQFYQHYNQQQLHQKMRHAEQLAYQQHQQQQLPMMHWNRNGAVCGGCNDCVCSCTNMAELCSDGKMDNGRIFANTLNNNLGFITANDNNTGIVVDVDQREPRGKSLESLEETQYAFAANQQRLLENTAIINQSAAAASTYYHPQYGMPFRSFDDGDVTPTNMTEMAIAMHHQQGGTLPRQRQRPIAKVVGTAQPLTNATVDYNKLDKAAALKQYVATAAQKVGVVGIGVGSKIQAPPEPPKRIITSGPVAPLNSQLVDMAGQFEALNVAQSTRGYPGVMHPQFNAAYYGMPAHPHQPTNGAQYMHNVQNTNQPIYANYAGQIQQTTVEIHAEKTQDSKSNSSIDSIDLPFANENLGTIRNRTMNNRQDQQQNHASLSSSSSSSSAASAGSVTTTIANGQGSGGCVGESNVNVLNDIGNMLANLTDELDLMLEQEKKILNEDDDLR